MDDPRATLTGLFMAAVRAADPVLCLPAHLPAVPPGRLIVVGAGKAAAAMARSVEDLWPATLCGLVVTRYGHGVPTRRIEVVEGGHPLPDDAGSAAARRILAVVGDAGEDDQLLCLLSGGASALLTLPPPPVTLAHKRSLTQALLRSGATIAEINCVRKHVSQIKGGRLAAAAPATPMLTLVISDVAGDDASTIASGPTVADLTTTADALNVLRKYGIELPDELRHHLRSPDAESPKPGDPRLARSVLRIIATATESLRAAAAVAQAAGLDVHLIGDRIEGEARDVAQAHATLIRRARNGELALRRPCVLLSGGEATVTVRGAGRGGPNTEYMLALALALRGSSGIYGLACDTDGIDGTDDAAGALITPDTLDRARLAGLDAGLYLAANDSYTFFDHLGDLVKTGPTRTNVNDFRALLLL